MASKQATSKLTLSHWVHDYGSPLTATLCGICKRLAPLFKLLAYSKGPISLGFRPPGPGPLGMLQQVLDRTFAYRYR